MKSVSIIFCILIFLSGCSKADDFEKGVAAEIKGNYIEAIKWYTKGALKEDLDCQFNLGTFYQEGKGVSIDFKEAAKWYQKSSDNGGHRASYNLARMYYEGIGFPQNYEKAFLLYKKSASKDNNYAQRMIGNMYYLGQYVQKDFQEAIKWYERVHTPETFVQLAGVNPYSQPKSIRTLSRRSFVQNDILPAGRKSAGN